MFKIQQQQKDEKITTVPLKFCSMTESEMLIQNFGEQPNFEGNDGYHRTFQIFVNKETQTALMLLIITKIIFFT